MKAVGGDIAREVDDTMVEDRVGRGVTQVNAGQPGIVGDGEGDLTADAQAMERVMALGYRQAPVVIAGDAQGE